MLELFESLRKLQHLLMQAVFPIVQEMGLAKNEVFVLMSVYYKKAFRMTDIAKRLDLPASTFTGIIDRMVSREFLVRVNDPEDRRSILLSATPKLEETIGQMTKIFDEKLKEIFEPVPPELLQNTIANLNCVYEIVKKNEEPADCPHTK